MEEWNITAQDRALIDLLVNKDSETITKMIVDSTKSTPSQSVENLKRLRTEIGLKITDVIHGVERSFDGFVVGQYLTPNEDTQGGFYKGKQYPVSHVFKDEIVIDNAAKMSMDEVRKLFSKTPIKSKK